MSCSSRRVAACRVAACRVAACRVATIVGVQHIHVHVLMRDAEGRKKEASKAMHTNNKAKLYMWVCCVALLCCLFDLACFFLPSFSKTCTYTCIYMYIELNDDNGLYVIFYISSLMTHTNTHTNTHKYTHTQTQTHTNTNTHKHKHTQTQTHKHTHKHTQPLIDILDPQDSHSLSQNLVLALYTYTAVSSDELSFHKGSVLTVLVKKGQWWKGELNGMVGLFPCNYVQPLNEQMPAVEATRCMLVYPSYLLHLCIIGCS